MSDYNDKDLGRVRNLGDGRFQTEDGVTHSQYDLDNKKAWAGITSPENTKKMGGAIGALFMIVGPFLYLGQFLQNALGDYGTKVSYGTAFLIGFLPILAFVVWQGIRFFTKGKGLIPLIVMALIVLPMGVMGFYSLLIGKDYFYTPYLNMQTNRFADGTNIHITAAEASLRTGADTDSAVISNLRKGASMMLIGSSDTGQVLVRYRKDGNKLVWGWIEADKTSYKNSSFKNLVPASINSETVLLLFQKTGSRELSTISNTIAPNAVVIGKSSNIFVGTKPKNGYVLVYAWNNETNYRYAGYAPTGSVGQ
jgi:hypothetical protein